MNNLFPQMFGLSKIRDCESRSISAENFTGEKGKGGMAETGTGASCARDLGKGWKISPSIEIKAGETFEIANIKESGIIKHIWMTDNSSGNRDRRNRNNFCARKYGRNRNNGRAGNRNNMGIGGNHRSRNSSRKG